MFGITSREFKLILRGNTDSQFRVFGDYTLPYASWHNVAHVLSASANWGMAWYCSSADRARTAGTDRKSPAAFIRKAAARAGHYARGSGYSRDSASHIATPALAAREADNRRVRTGDAND